MSQIKSLQCSTVYGFREEFSTCIDCIQINGLEEIHVTDSGYKNFNAVETLKGLGLSNYEKRDIRYSFNIPEQNNNFRGNTKVTKNAMFISVL